MKLSHEAISLHTRYPFVIARGGYASHENVVVRIEDKDGLEGFGEAAPNRYYGETVESVVATLERFIPLLATADAWSLEAIEAQMGRTLRGNASAKGAISAALHDLVGKRVGLPVYRLWGRASRSPSRTTKVSAAASLMRPSIRFSRSSWGRTATRRSSA